MRRYTYRQMILLTDMLDKNKGAFTPFVSDTDISLTDVSALGTLSPMVSVSVIVSLFNQSQFLRVLIGTCREFPLKR